MPAPALAPPDPEADDYDPFAIGLPTLIVAAKTLAVIPGGFNTVDSGSSRARELRANLVALCGIAKVTRPRPHRFVRDVETFDVGCDTTSKKRRPAG